MDVAVASRTDAAEYPFKIRQLTVAEGGGYLISYPDFSECISDGETEEEARTNGRDALLATITALKAAKLPVPEPGSKVQVNS